MERASEESAGLGICHVFRKHELKYGGVEGEGKNKYSETCGLKTLAYIRVDELSLLQLVAPHPEPPLIFCCC